jgi:hypothetical protein
LRNKMKKYIFLIVILLMGVLVYQYQWMSQIKNSKIETYFLECDSLSFEDQAICWEKTMAKVLRTESLPMALGLFKKIATTRDIECHGLAHRVGKMTYEKYGFSPAAIFGNDSYDSLKLCGWGFWHGYIASYVGSNSGPEVLYQACMSIPSRLDGLEDCFHGIGIGAVGDPPKKELWGDAGEMAKIGVDLCDKVLGKSQFVENCYQGAFHQIVDYMTKYSFELMPPPEDSQFVFCASQTAKYQHACFMQMAPGAYARSSKKIFTNALEIERIRKLSFYNEIVASMVSGAVNISTDGDDVLTPIYKECARATGLSKPCISGAIGGELGKGDAEVKVKKLRTWCESISNQSDKEYCLNSLPPSN